MDWKKILEASKWPIAGILAIMFVNVGLSFLKPTSSFLDVIASVLGLVKTAFMVWIGYNGVKTFKFGYMEAAIGGSIAGIISLIIALVGGIATNSPVITFFQTKTNLQFAVALILILNGVGLPILYSLGGAFIAKKLK